MKILVDKKYLPLRAAIGFIMGIIVGLLFTDFSIWVKPFGTVFMNLIKMLIIPVVFFSVGSGIASMGDVQKLKRIGGKIMLIYTVMTILACFIGVVVAKVMRPGLGVVLDNAAKFTSEVTTPSIGDFFLGMIPSNVISSMASGDVMQVIFFTILLGIALVMLGEKGKMITDLMNQGATACYKILDIIMIYSPIGIFALMANAIAVYGVNIFGVLGKFILCDWLGVVLIWIVIMSIPLVLYTKIDYKKFVKSISRVWMMTLATTSSTGTIPVTLDVTVNELKVPEWMASFTIPLGATVNLTGAALYKTLLAFFVADFYGLSLTVEQIAIVITISTIMSIAAPGIPGGGIVTGAIFLNLMGLPFDLMGPIAGLYRLIDMGHTTVNVSGDVVGTLLLAKSEGVWKAEDFNRSNIEKVAAKA
ncbi:dicarboxylate/amino acid:cation symporter [Lutispora saccharofermentans]|uniref:Dicarboxylate/amino acid:cation symporter n=1 Tax=Lutispora saccharofermentans TaxID=3024236 RepID=A0ABT1NEJ9_9FIRM|nr:dicarboxylate/amino acid:cation symporter [Lutispora saccharofermentans]MCQ1529494.1 dicarboxylate/amino acid:cation symporter [Lutispora saccharofermentans]